MAPKIPSVISCSSIALLEHELSIVRTGLELTEAEDTWDKICNALLRLNALTVGSAADYPSQLIIACKGLVRPIMNALNSERSRLSGCATDVLISLATHLGRPFESLIPLHVPTLLGLASRSNKIFIARAKACLLAIVENCQSPIILPLLRHAISDKSVMLRLTATDLVVACLNCFNPPDLESPNRVDDIEAVIRATARDPSADVRKSSRKAFEAYKVLFPSRLDAFVAPLTPTMKKYLDIKSAPANQRKPLLLSSSTSAPSIPSASQPSDVLSRSQPPVQGHVKSASTSSAAFTRVEKPSKSSKPPSAEQAAECAAMPPPPPPKQKSSSGPIRPPPEMRQAVAAAAPARPFMNRQASRIVLKKGATDQAVDISKSQSVSQKGAQRPEKTPTPPPVLPASDTAQQVSTSHDAEPRRVRSTTGPRRVLKPDPVPVETAGPPAAPAPSRKMADNPKESVKGKEKEKPTFAPSTSSTTSVQANAPVFSPLASGPASAADEIQRLKEKEERRKESRKRPESRTGGEFRPRPASRADGEVHKRSDSKNEEVRVRPASRMDGRVHPRPPSRMERPHSRMEGEAPLLAAPRKEKRTQARLESRTEAVAARPESRVEEKAARPESRAELKTERPKKKRPVDPTDQAPPQPQVEVRVRSGLEASDLARKEEKRKRRAARAEAEAASKRSKEERAMHEKPSKKRRGEAKGAEVKQSEVTEAALTEAKIQAGSAALLQHMASANVMLSPVPTSKVDDQSPFERQPVNLPEDVATLKCDVFRKHPQTKSSSSISNGDTSEAMQGGLITTRDLPAQEEEAVPIQQVVSEFKTPTRPVKPKSGHQVNIGVKPLAIHKNSNGSTPNDLDADIAASEIPLPPSPPEHSYQAPRFVTPAPLRQAVASCKYQVPATPISKLLDSIQRGFDPDFSIIGEETGGVIAPSDMQPQLEILAEERSEDQDADEEQNVFIDTRPRRFKSSHGKERGGHNEERVPLIPRTDNRQ